MRKEGGKYAHLNEELHLLVECFAETVDAYGRIANAVTKIKEFMNPVSKIRFILTTGICVRSTHVI